jgi:nucleotide-binding universal stress UspA family protein
MSLRTILVPISAADSSRSALETACQIAAKFGAHVEALHVRTDPRGLVPYTGEGMDGSMIEEIMDVTEREGRERQQKAREMFRAFCAAKGIKETDRPTSGPEVTIAWKEEVGREDEVVAVRGRVFDLIVVGRPLRDQPLPSPVTLEAAMLDSGRPIVVASPRIAADCGASIAVAWEGTREAARAIADATPFFEKAATVTIMAGRALADETPKPEDYVEKLAWHGVNARIHRFEGGLADLGTAYLREASKLGADLLVKGAYSQSRIRQLIFGGRTAHILAHAEIPVLFSHC